MSIETATEETLEETNNNFEITELITIEDETDLSVLSGRSKNEKSIYSVHFSQNLPSTSKSQTNTLQVRPPSNRSLKRKLNNASEDVSQGIDKALTTFGNFLQKRSQPSA